MKGNAKCRIWGGLGVRGLLAMSPFMRAPTTCWGPMERWSAPPYGL